MRKLKLQVQVSLDGFVEDIHGGTDWMLWNWGDEHNWDDELRRYHKTLTESVDCILLGNKNEVRLTGNKESVEQKRHNDQFSFVKNIPEGHKIILSKRDGNWHGASANSDTLTIDTIHDILELKNKKGKDILVYGDSSFISSLINEGLLDEFYLVINPVALGKGTSIFEVLRTKLTMTLAHTKQYEKGIMVAKYIISNN